METLNLWIPIGIGILTIFMFYSSGSIIANLFNLKQVNGFINIALGFFVFFAFTNLTILPFQIISVLTIKFFVFFMYGVVVIYLLFCLIFIKYWFSLDIFSFKNLIYLLITAFISIVLYFNYKYVSTSVHYETETDVIRILHIFSNEFVGTIPNNSLLEYVKYEQYESFYLLQVMAVNLLKFNNGQFDIDTLKVANFFTVLSLIQVSFLLSSIFMHFFDFSNGKKFSGYKIISILFGLIFISFSLSIMTWSGVEFYSRQALFIFLLVYLIVLLINYSSKNNRASKIPMLISLILFSYSAFSWESSYPMIFLIYVVMFSLQRVLQSGFIKDVLKISLLPSINILFYSFISKTYLQSIIFLVALGLILITYIALYKKQSLITKWEIFLKERNVFLLMFLPIVFAIVSSGLALGYDENIINQDDSYYSFLNLWADFIFNGKVKEITTLIVSIVLIALSFVWLIFRGTFKKNSAFIISLDLSAIMYLTFYNPFVIRFVNIIYPGVINDSGSLMAVLILFNFIYGFNSISQLIFKDKVESNKITIRGSFIKGKDKYVKKNSRTN